MSMYPSHRHQFQRSKNVTLFNSTVTIADLFMKEESYNKAQDQIAFY